MKLNISPTLIISSDAGSIIKDCVEKGFPLVTGTVDEIYKKVYSLRNAHLSNPLVIGDINPMIAGKSIEIKLLKVLEELYIDVIFVSSVDCFSLIFLSRFMQIVKNVIIYKTQVNSKEVFISLLKSEESSLRSVLKEFPEGLEIFHKYKKSNFTVKSKLLELL